MIMKSKECEEKMRKDYLLILNTSPEYYHRLGKFDKFHLNTEFQGSHS